MMIMKIINFIMIDNIILIVQIVFRNKMNLIITIYIIKTMNTLKKTLILIKTIVQIVNFNNF